MAHSLAKELVALWMCRKAACLKWLVPTLSLKESSVANEQRYKIVGGFNLNLSLCGRDILHS